MTESGGTARFLSRFRSDVPIFGLSRHDGARRRMALMRDVFPIDFDSRGLATREAAREAIKQLFDAGPAGRRRPRDLHQRRPHGAPRRDQHPAPAAGGRRGQGRRPRRAVTGCARLGHGHSTCDGRLSQAGVLYIGRRQARSAVRAAPSRAAAVAAATAAIAEMHERFRRRNLAGHAGAGFAASPCRRSRAAGAFSARLGGYIAQFDTRSAPTATTPRHARSTSTWTSTWRRAMPSPSRADLAAVAEATNSACATTRTQAARRGRSSATSVQRHHLPDPVHACTPNPASTLRGLLRAGASANRDTAALGPRVGLVGYAIASPGPALDAPTAMAAPMQRAARSSSADLPVPTWVAAGAGSGWQRPTGACSARCRMVRRPMPAASTPTSGSAASASSGFPGNAGACALDYTGTQVTVDAARPFDGNFDFLDSGLRLSGRVPLRRRADARRRTDAPDVRGRPVRQPA